MSIILTDDEVSILLHENTFLTDGDFARAIQLALIEKIRAEPVAWLDGDSEYVDWFHNLDRFPVFTLPTAQELENE